MRGKTKTEALAKFKQPEPPPLSEEARQQIAHEFVATLNPQEVVAVDAALNKFEREGTVFIIGGGNTVWDDLEKARALYGDRDVIAVNDIGMEYRGDLVAWVSVHGEKLLPWTRHRATAGLTPAGKTFTGLSAGDWQNVRDGIDECVQVLWPEQKHSGSSGLFAVKIALDHLHYKRVILCGIPMTSAGQHYFKAEKWDDAFAYWPSWQDAFEARLKGKVYSMSGWTRDLLGEPPAN